MALFWSVVALCGVHLTMVTNRQVPVALKQSDSQGLGGELWGVLRVANLQIPKSAAIASGNATMRRCRERGVLAIAKT